MNQCGVYVIRCESTSQEYVGASTNIVKRLREHFYQFEKGIHHNHGLQSAYNEYGKDSFTSKVVLYCDPSNVELYGKQIIENLHPEFNIVNTRKFKRVSARQLKAALKSSTKQLEWESRFFIKLRKQVDRAQKRTHRL
jgi:group I intron endonuclease